MSKVELWCIQEDDTDEIVAMSKKKEELERAILEMKIRHVLKDMKVTEADFFERLQKVKLSIKRKIMVDPDKEEKKKKKTYNKEEHMKHIIDNPDEIYCDCAFINKEHGEFCNTKTRKQKNKDIIFKGV